MFHFKKNNMNVSNLQENHPLLLDYLQDKGYSYCQIQWIKRCIKLVLDTGSLPEIDSYEQLYWHEVKRRGYKESAPVRKTLRYILGNVKEFDQKGVFPGRGLNHGFLAPPKSYDLLVEGYKSIVDHYVN